jgi:hypothetical protein
MLTRRHFLLGSLAAVAAGCQESPTTNPSNVGVPATPTTMPVAWHLRCDAAQKKASEWLASKQSDDGAWRSDVYGTFKDGTALTPLALYALILADPKSPAIPKGVKYVAGMAQADGSIRAPERHGFDFPLYTAALAATALSHPTQAEHGKARDAWLKFLRDRQLTEQHGWTPRDREYGGWGYCHGLPLKPNPGAMASPMTESNLSATTFALAAFKAAGASALDPVYKALTFVKRCQNWADVEKKGRGRYDDGGFYFIYDDPIRNKAGEERDDQRRQRYFSYGSTTADGIRCLEMCGEPKFSLRLSAAREWLRTHFQPDRCPGPFGDRLEANRAAVYFYYTMSMAQTPLDQWLVDVNGVPRMWREALADAVIARQHPDGSWANAADAFRENDPIVATSFACIAVANCRGPLRVNSPG